MTAYIIKYFRKGWLADILNIPDQQKVIFAKDVDAALLDFLKEFSEEKYEIINIKKVK